MRAPKLEAVPPRDLKEIGIITQTRTYKLITPLFGGGVVAAETDPVTPIRGTAVRGHLRFWWRATRGGQFQGKLADMKAAEDELWGAAANVQKKTGPSKVQVAIKTKNYGKPDSPFEIVKNKKGQYQSRPRKGSVVPAYAAFPLQPSREETYKDAKTKTVQVGISFELTISYPKEARDDVEAALWAWETFGGIGARTRRGFGALQCTRIKAGNGEETNVSLLPCDQMSEQIRDGLSQHVVEGLWPDDVPHLARDETQFKVTDKNDDGPAAWDELIKKLVSFRQARDGGKYGPSLWPEPKEIRAAARKDEKELSQDKFPRARLGLPILFHFPQFKDLKQIEFLLKGVDDIERLSSPLVLRPLVCSGGAVGIGLILQTPTEPPGGLLLVERDKKKETHHSIKQTSKIANVPVLHGNTDVLQAFLETL